MKTAKILRTTFFLIGIALMIVSLNSVVDFGLQLPEFIMGGSGISMAIMSFAGVTLPTEAGYEDGEENMGGNGVVAYLALMADIETWPAELTAPTTLDEMVKLSGNFTMKASKYFMKVLVPADTLSDDSEGQGDPGNRSFKNKGVFKLPGKDAENRGLARRLNNARGVLIIPTDQGYRVMYGSENRPVQFMPSGSSGLKAADFKGFEYAWECDSHAPGHTYNGTIALSGAITLPAIS